MRNVLPYTGDFRGWHIIGKPGINPVACPMIVRVILGGGTPLDEAVALRDAQEEEIDWAQVERVLSLIDSVDPVQSVPCPRRFEAAPLPLRLTHTRRIGFTIPTLP